MKQTVESTIINDRYLESIAYSLLKEAKETPEGYIFKKLVPAMAFFCFTLESKLNSYGEHVFSDGEKKRYINSTLIGKLDWLFSRINVVMNDDIETIRNTIVLMIEFRNSLVHSKPVNFQEERELIGLENFAEKYIIPTRPKNDFMEIRSIENADNFQDAVYKFDLIWMHYSQIYFPDFNPQMVFGAPTAKVISPKSNNALK
jgi:hypothetical protein